MWYLSEAWERYRENFGKLLAIGILSVLVAIMFSAVPLAGSILSGLTASIVTVWGILTLTNREENAGEIVKRGVLSYIASLVVGILVALVVILIIVVGVVLASLIPPLGIAVLLIGILVALLLALKFYYIPYLAAKGEGFENIIKKAWMAKYTTILKAVTTTFLVQLAAIIPIAAIFTGAFVSAMHTLPYLTGKSESIWAILVSVLGIQTVVAITVMTLIIFGFIAPLTWAIMVVSAKEGLADEGTR